MSIYACLHIYDPAKSVSVEFNRLNHLAAACQKKRVLHVGCSDWPITESRITSGNLLHSRLEAVAESVIGIDLSEEGINIMRAHGFDNVQVMDAERMPFENEFDVILAGDVLEHMNNPGLFLESAKRALRPGGEIVIAVPSALTFANVKSWLKNREQVHKDHTFYYSPKTLSTLCSRFDLLPTKLRYTVQPAGEYESRWYILARSLILKVWPNAAPAIIMHFSNSESVDRARSVTLA